MKGAFYMQISFDILSRACKWGHISFDIDHEVVDACDNRNNRTFKYSWGDCCEEYCPLLGKCEEIDIKENDNAE